MHYSTSGRQYLHGLSVVASTPGLNIFQASRSLILHAAITLPRRTEEVKVHPFFLRFLTSGPLFPTEKPILGKENSGTR